MSMLINIEHLYKYETLKNKEELDAIYKKWREHEDWGKLNVPLKNDDDESVNHGSVIFHILIKKLISSSYKDTLTLAEHTSYSTQLIHSGWEMANSPSSNTFLFFFDDSTIACSQQHFKNLILSNTHISNTYTGLFYGPIELALRFYGFKAAFVYNALVLDIQNEWFWTDIINIQGGLNIATRIWSEFLDTEYMSLSPLIDNSQSLKTAISMYSYVKNNAVGKEWVSGGIGKITLEELCEDKLLKAIAKNNTIDNLEVDYSIDSIKTFFNNL